MQKSMQFRTAVCLSERMQKSEFFSVWLARKRILCTSGESVFRCQIAKELAGCAQSRSIFQNSTQQMPSCNLLSPSLLAHGAPGGCSRGPSSASTQAWPLASGSEQHRFTINGDQHVRTGHCFLLTKLSELKSPRAKIKLGWRATSAHFCQY